MPPLVIQEIQGQSLYRVKFAISIINHVKTRYQYIPCLTWIEKIYTFTYFQYLSLGLLKKGRRSGFHLYESQKLKIHQIWLKMVSNYLSQKEILKTE